MVLQSLSDCIYKRSQVKEAVPETAFVYQYSFWLTAMIAFGCLVSWYSFISWPRSRAYRPPR